MSTENKEFLIGIIGSGPIGLECGLHALKHGYSFIIFESGETIAHNVHLWSHVRLFTPLHMNMSQLGKSLLKQNYDENKYLTGGEFIEQYLRPISTFLESNIRLKHRVVSVGRYNEKKFVMLVENDKSSCEEYIIVDCVIDASGTYSSPKFIGPGYLPAINERQLRSINPLIITYKIPNLKYEQLAGKRIVLIGKGHSAATSAVFLSKVKQLHPETQLFWIIKQKIDHLPYCSNPEDPLEHRRQLADDVNQIYANKSIFTKIFTNTIIKKLDFTNSSTSVDITLDTTSNEILQNIDYIIANVGSQPDRSIYANLCVHECYRSKGPMALAIKLLSSANTDCLVQQSHGANSMLTTEKYFFIVGNKSYGTQTNFLMKIGFEQVTDVFQLIDEHRQTS